MVHAIATYLREIWDMMDWIFQGQQEFRTRFSCESQVITVFQDIADCLDNGDRINAIKIDFPKAFDLVPHMTGCLEKLQLREWTRGLLYG
jgi:hypothetical protein